MEGYAPCWALSNSFIVILVDVVLGSRDLLTGDQEPHICLHQILRIVRLTLHWP
jgi:hypothetical protein